MFLINISTEEQSNSLAVSPELHNTEFLLYSYQNNLITFKPKYQLVRDLQQHKRSLINPVTDIPDINQRIQGKTGYNSYMASKLFYSESYMKYQIRQKKG